MTEYADVKRIQRSEELPSSAIMLGWVIIAGITALGFSALAYAVGKYIGMNAVCR